MPDSRDSDVAHVMSAKLEAHLKLEPPHHLDKNDNNDGDESVRIFASHFEQVMSPGCVLHAQPPSSPRVRYAGLLFNTQSSPPLKTVTTLTSQHNHSVLTTNRTAWRLIW
jgi:hypothetical protein